MITFIKTVIYFSFLMLFVSPASAQDQKILCRILPAYVPSGDVAPADYVPGVDVRGKAVAPADLHAAHQIDVVRIPLTLDLAREISQYEPAQWDFGGLGADARLGMLEIHSDGTVLYDGADLSTAAYAVCGKPSLNGQPAQAIKDHVTDEKDEQAGYDNGTGTKTTDSKDE